MPKPSGSFWISPNGLAALALIAAAAYFLLAEHRAHAIAALPWLILLLCPLLHVFMHRGHGHGRNDANRNDGAGGAGRPGIPGTGEKDG